MLTKDAPALSVRQTLADSITTKGNVDAIGICGVDGYACVTPTGRRHVYLSPGGRGGRAVRRNEDVAVVVAHPDDIGVAIRHCDGADVRTNCAF